MAKKEKEKEWTYEYNPVKETVGGKEAERVVWTTKSLNMAVEAISQGLPLKSNPFCGKNTKLLRPELVYKRTQEELEDFLRCKEDPVYFGEKCFLMTPEGLRRCDLRDYQKEYLYHLRDHRFSILCACRQAGKTACLLTMINIYIPNTLKNVKIDTLRRKYKHFYINNKLILTVPLFELYNIFGVKNRNWKIKYNLYKFIFKLKNYPNTLKIIEHSYNIISWLDNKEFGKIKDRVIYNISLPKGLEIETDTGYKPISNLMYKIPFENWKIILENGYELDCADEHIVFKDNFEETFVKDLKIGDSILTDVGPSKVVYIENTGIKVCMGDLTVDDENHRFYSNGILSHNSITTGIYTLWRTLFNIDNNALVLSKSGPAGRDLVKKVKDMYLYLPYHLKCGTMKWNQSEVSFDNGSSFKTEAFGPTAGLGSTINTLVLDEFAWCPPNDVELFYENIIPTVTTMPNSNVCIISTQNGFNKFYQIWNGAITGKNNYAPFKVDWYQVPNYNPQTKEWEPRTEEWKNMMIGVLGSEEAFYYQYGTQFSSSDKCLISREKLTEIRENTILYKERGDELNSLVMLNPQNIYWDPEYDLSLLKEKYYVLTIDLAEGGGGDYTIFHICEVTDKDRFKEVGYYRSNKISLEDVACDFWLMCPQLFSENKFIASIEWNTYGALFYQYLLQLNEQEYRPELGVRFNYVKEFDFTCIANYKKGSQEEIDINGKKSNRKEIPGIRLSSSNKITGCMLLKMMIEKDELIVNDVVTASEIENFEDKNGNGSYSASYGHDDLVMSLIQLPLLKNTSRYKNFIDEIELTKQRNSIESNNNFYGFNASDWY